MQDLLVVIKQALSALLVSLGCLYGGLNIDMCF